MSANAREPIGVIGTGYVGLVTAAGFAELGSDVYCIDIDVEKIEGLKAGRIPIWEPGLAELVERHRDRLHFSTDLADALEHARLLFVAVGTPPTYSGDADLSAVHAVVEAMPASDRHALVMKSTVPCGTGDHIKRAFREQGKEGFRYVSCPEFLKEGSAVKDFLEPDRVVIGDDGDWAGDAVADLYAPLDAPLVRTDIKSAEMVKLASNAFLATKISFINEIANVCEETGADVVEVARGMGLDDRIGPKFLQAGIGFGGSCFPKDVSALKQLAGNSGYHFQLLNAVIEVNELQKRRVMSKLQKYLGTLVGKEIALLGLAFKPNTDDMREASSLVLSARLQAAGAKVRAYDPVAEARGAQAAAGRRLRRLGRGGRRRRRCRRARHRVAGVPRARPARDGGEHARHAAGRRPQLPRPGRRGRGGPVLRGRRAPEHRRSHAGGGGGLMQALILAGGEGTRLRPLTTTVPKPVVPLVDRPFIAFMLDWLRTHGVDDIVISCGHMASGVRNVLGDGSAFGVKLRYVEEPTPLGTGGALKYAESLLDDRFLMLNGDVLTDIDLSAQLAQHERTGAVATLALTPVDDPTNYGLVRTDGDGAVTEFVEKPSYDQIDTRNISAGAYVLERSVLDLLEAEQPASIERDVFPQLVGSGLYGCVSENYWLDIGTPARYLEATFDILEGTVGTAFAERAGDGYLVVEQSAECEGRIIPSALVESGCRIAEGARVGGRVVLESGVTVGPNTTIERTVVMRGAEIGANCTLSGCIVGGGVRIGDNTHVEGLSVLGEGVTIGADNVIANGARIFPGVELPDGAIRF